LKFNFSRYLKKISESFVGITARENDILTLNNQIGKEINVAYEDLIEIERQI